MTQKKLYLDEKKEKYCIVLLYDTKAEMQEAYKKKTFDKRKDGDLLGAHRAYEKWTPKRGGKEEISNETGTLFLSRENLGVGVVYHEIMHAILWAWKHKKNKKQYPLVIKNMNEEEKILHSFSFAAIQFNKWHWKMIEGR